MVDETSWDWNRCPHRIKQENGSWWCEMDGSNATDKRCEECLDPLNHDEPFGMGM